MKITKMWTEIYRWKRNKPIRNGMYTYTDAGLNVVKVETDEGITGIGLGGGMTDDGRVFQAIGTYSRLWSKGRTRSLTRRSGTICGSPSLSAGAGSPRG